MSENQFIKNLSSTDIVYLFLYDVFISILFIYYYIVYF